ncbi:MAG: signal peptidase II [Coprococcus sp.]|nr:signal peptidase II [Coprococcus sp.]
MAGICLTIILAVAAGDLGLKRYIEKHMKENESRRILGGKGILRRTHNRGMMMNRMEKYPVFVRLSSAAASVAILIWQSAIWRLPGQAAKKVGLALITGGAVSNTYDRFKRRYVVDYFSFSSKNKKLERIAFNFGDFAVFAGCLLVALQEAYTVGKELLRRWM